MAEIQRDNWGRPIPPPEPAAGIPADFAEIVATVMELKAIVAKAEDQRDTIIELLVEAQHLVDAWLARCDAVAAWTAETRETGSPEHVAVVRAMDRLDELTAAYRKKYRR